MVLHDQANYSSDNVHIHEIPVGILYVSLYLYLIYLSIRENKRRDSNQFTVILLLFHFHIHWSILGLKSILLSSFIYLSSFLASPVSGKYCSHFFFPCSTILHSITIDLKDTVDIPISPHLTYRHFSCHTIRQKSSIVVRIGP